MTCVTGTRVGGLSPRLTPSLSRIWSNGVRQAAGSGDQLGRSPPSCGGVVCVCTGGAGWTPLYSAHPAPAPQPPGRRPRLETEGRTRWCPGGRRCPSSRARGGAGRPAHLHAVLEGGQRLGLVVLGQGPAHAAVPLIPLCAGAAGTSRTERGCALSGWATSPRPPPRPHPQGLKPRPGHPPDLHGGTSASRRAASIVRCLWARPVNVGTSNTPPLTPRAAAGTG